MGPTYPPSPVGIFYTRARKDLKTQKGITRGTKETPLKSRLKRSYFWRCCQMGSNIDIMVHFVKTMYTRQPSDHERQSIVKGINELLSRGLSEDQIVQAINRHARQRGKETNLEKIFEKEVADPESPNLIRPGRFYYHSELRLTPPPPRARYNAAERRIERTVTPYFLEIKASFTLGELVNYYCNKMRVEPNSNNIARYKAIFLRLLESYSLDEILFTIDAAAEIRTHEHMAPLNNPFGLSDYLHIGQLNLQTKVSASKEEGVDKVVYRERERIFTT